MSSIYMYWDHSHIWGLLLWRTLHEWGLSHTLITAEDIRGGILSRKPPAVLLVPGGSARKKFTSLGRAGVRAVQEYVHAGGVYTGLCGGCGLALSEPSGLGLCPWKRRPFKDLSTNAISGHLVSGHMTGTLPDTENPLIPHNMSSTPLLPVWWPARFAPVAGAGVTVLAQYAQPGDDFWIADLPLASIEKHSLDVLEKQYGLHVWPENMSGQPVVIQGTYGKGQYVLSYSHLETPASPDANHWLAHMMQTFTAQALFSVPPITDPTIGPITDPITGPTIGPVSDWTLHTLPCHWSQQQKGQDLVHAKNLVEDIIAQGKNQLLLVERNSWLLGWRRGIPGSHINTLHAFLAQIQNLTPNPKAVTYWKKQAPFFLETLKSFEHKLSTYLLAERLAMTLGDAPHTIPQQTLAQQRLALFGKHMDAGGLFATLLDTLDTLFYTCVRP